MEELYLIHSQEQKQAIVDNYSDPYSVRNFLSSSEVEILKEFFHSRPDQQVKKPSGPLCLQITNDLDKELSWLKDKVISELGNVEIYAALYFDVETPHVLHNDDSKDGGVSYKAITLPLEIRGDVDQFPGLVFFDQYYLEGPAKFFKGTVLDPHRTYNETVLEYDQVQGKVEGFVNREFYNKYLKHIRFTNLEGLSVNTMIDWKVGNAIIFDSTKIHCATNFKELGVESKLGLSLFTKKLF